MGVHCFDPTGKLIGKILFRNGRQSHIRADQGASPVHAATRSLITLCRRVRGSQVP